MIKYLLSAVCLASVAHAEPMLGYDILGLAHPKQDLAMIAREMRAGSALGLLENTFGPAVPALQKMLATGKVAVFRVHLMDATCWRNRVCPPGTPQLSDLKELKRRAIPYEQIAVAYGAKCYMSPWLEHDIKDVALIKKAFAMLKTVAPHCTLVQSPVSGAIISGPLLEKHGTPARGDIISGDGNSNFDMDLPNWYPRAKQIAFLWWPRCNLRTSGEKTFTPPKARKNPVLQSEMQQATALMNRPTPRPAFATCPNAKELRPPEIYKTRAEESQNGPTDARQNKPILIAKLSALRLDVFEPSGNAIGCLNKYSTYPPIPGTNRFYVGNCSGQDAIGLMKAARQEWVCIKGGGREIAVSSIRRSGSFR